MYDFLQLAFCDGAVDELLDCAVNGFFGFTDAGVLREFAAENEQSRVHISGDVCIDAGEQAGIFNEVDIQACRLPVGENV